MVIDLTNSSRYYSADSDGTSEFEYSAPDLPTVYHRKVLVLLAKENHPSLHSSILAVMLSGVQIPCRGRGQAPQPDAVNEFCWTITAFNQHCQHEGKALWTIVHCTHGFNRTGNMSKTVVPVPRQFWPVAGHNVSSRKPCAKFEQQQCVCHHCFLILHSTAAMYTEQLTEDLQAWFYNPRSSAFMCLLRNATPNIGGIGCRICHCKRPSQAGA